MTTPHNPLTEIERAEMDYRTAERIRFREEIVDGFSAVERSVREHIDADPEFRDAALTELNDIFLELHHRRIEGGLPIKQYEAHHEDQVCREALLIMLADTQNPKLSGDFVRRRMCLTATPEEFFLEKPEADETPAP